MKDCPFCAISVGQAPANGLWEPFPGTASFEPLNPVTPGHVLVVPQAHCERLEDVVGDDLWCLMTAVRLVGEAVAGDYNVIQSNGPAATQTVPHVHFHIVPRCEGDGLSLPWTGQVALPDQA